jgi:uncharacterized protein YukE
MYGLPSPDEGLDYGGQAAAAEEMEEEVVQDEQMATLAEEIEERLRQQRREKLYHQMEEVKQLMRAELAQQGVDLDDRNGHKLPAEAIEHLDFGEDVDQWVKLAVKLQNALEDAEERLAHAGAELQNANVEIEGLGRTVELQERRMDALREEKAHLRQRAGSSPPPRGVLVLPSRDPRLSEKEQEIARLCNENRRQRIEMVPSLSLLRLCR